uniref:Capsule polysaccharide biosynthesis protein n=1 Tax=uncultured Flavobacteriia bacterium TaxID=212695 RepID=H6REM3_9BACT|nr:capsule polysaccharide biosynthesis protein [uncultured Flavobacteriia bacterium]
MKFKTGIYLGSNIDESSYEYMLSKKNIVLFASKVFPERVHSKYKGKLNYFDENLDQIYSESFDYELIDSVISDYNLSLLWNRFHFRFRKKFRTEISRYEFQLSIIHSSIHFIKKHNLENIYFAYEPHNLLTYIFKKVCIYLGINSVTMRVSPFVSRLFAYDDLKKTIIENKNKDAFALEKFIKSREFNSANHDEMSRVSINFPLNISLYHNLRYHKYLFKSSTPRDQIFKSDFIIFFLHYQPESTTLPDGGVFVSQFEALKVLSKLCESLNFKLVVRDHPATVRFFNKNWRSKYFVDKIKNIGKNVVFDDYRKSNVEILKKCKAVATITGTVINEGLVNGIPVITFGDHPFHGWRGKSIVQFKGSFDRLISSFKIALQLKKDEIIKETKNYLSFASKKSFGGDFLGIEKDSQISILWFNRHKAFKDYINSIDNEN